MHAQYANMHAACTGGVCWLQYPVVSCDNVPQHGRFLVVKCSDVRNIHPPLYLRRRLAVPPPISQTRLSIMNHENVYDLIVSSQS